MATWEGTFLNGRYRIYLVAERFCPCMCPVRYSSKTILRSKKNVRSNIRVFERRLHLKSFTAPLPTDCSNANQRHWLQVEASATKSWN